MRSLCGVLDWNSNRRSNLGFKRQRDIGDWKVLSNLDVTLGHVVRILL